MPGSQRFPRQRLQPLWENAQMNVGANNIRCYAGVRRIDTWQEQQAIQPLTCATLQGGTTEAVLLHATLAPVH